MWQYILESLQQLASVTGVLYILLGATVGMLFGSLPGLSGGTIMVMLLPITYRMDPVLALALFIAIHIGSTCGGCIGSILLGIPGTSSSLATTWDGYEFTKQGDPVRPLSVAVVCNFIGTIPSIIIAMLAANVLAHWGVKLGPWEYAAMCFCAVAMVIGLSEGNLRQEGKILGSEALTAFAGSLLMEKEQASMLLEQLVRDAAFWPETDLMPVVYTGSAQETAEVYCLMEQDGLNVVAEDKIPGWRYCDRDVEEMKDPVMAISLRYHLRFPSSERGFVMDRKNCIPELVSHAGAKGLVVFMNHNDESYIWDLPSQREVLNERGIPVLSIEDQYWPLKDTEGLREKFAAFAKEGGR